jgi:N-acyl-D-aspartate/D-glutamate deacylase
MFADLVLFDPARVGIDDVAFVADMPAGGTRLIAQPVGIVASIVNGAVVVQDNELTGARPGALLLGG